MSKKQLSNAKGSRRVFSEEFKQEAVQMMLDGHTASSVCARLGLTGTNILYRWKLACENWSLNFNACNVNAIS